MMFQQEVTHILDENNYFPSYNIPLTIENRNISGYYDMLEKHPEMIDR
jgi:hypothetical protein